MKLVENPMEKESSLEVVPCPICGEARYEEVHGGFSAPFSHEPTSIVRCVNCGLKYVNPIPKVECFQAGYEGADEGGLYDAEELDRAINFRIYMRLIDRIATVKGRILDIGCCNGYFLDIAKADGWDASGVEPSSKMVQSCRDKGFNVYNGTILNSEVPKEVFDVVTLWDVIEHLRDPIPEFRRINSFLKPGGLICIWTKDNESLRARVMGKSYPFISGQHILYYSPQTIGLLLDKCGFDMVKIYRPGMRMTLKRIMKRFNIKNPVLERMLGTNVFNVNFFDNMLVFGRKR